tara:strand:+ start:1410 stop:1727 length:318 start_codon:yes stop_codon:yes gene_type:complete
MDKGCDAMNVIDKLNQEFDEVTEKNIQLEKEKEYWEKEYWDLVTEYKFMMCYYQYKKIPNDGGGDINDPNSPMGKLLFDLPNTSFWKDDFHDDFTQFIEDLMKQY